MALPALEQPAECRRENTRRFFISQLPGMTVMALLFCGEWGWAAFVFWAVFFIIGYGSVVPSSRLFGSHVSELSEAQAQRHQVWITLDDGPDPEITPMLLDILDRYQAKAGFFLIGDRAQKHPDLVRDIARRGHLIGNHSQTHPSANFWILRPGRMWGELAGCQQTLTDILGVAPVWFRPPVGHHNMFLFPPLKALGLTMAIWNCRGFDGVVKNPDLIFSLIERQLKPGSIILLHDAVPVGPEILETTLRLIQARGLHAALPDIASPHTPA